MQVRPPNARVEESHKICEGEMNLEDSRAVARSLRAKSLEDGGGTRYPGPSEVHRRKSKHEVNLVGCAEPR